ncbi:Rmf/CrpP fold protein [Streptomyces sp. NPDC057592]|uniref:Rmf/CrpP fold protein n=1 Tax=unclassified Streptomyces TaxID=2593676 RepID=UPI003694E260
MGFREDALRARQTGFAAARAGRPPTVCPYPATSLLGRAWIRGYTKNRLVRVSFTQ